MTENIAIDSQQPEKRRVSFFEDHLVREQMPVNPDDELELYLDAAEKAELAQLGVPIGEPRDRQTRHMATVYGVRRGDLAQAGIALINRVSRQNEKGLLMGKIQNTDGETINLSKQAFITQEQLDAVYKYQAEHRTHPVDFELLVEEAFKFIDRMIASFNDKERGPKRIVHTAVEELKQQCSPEEEAALEAFFEEKTKAVLTMSERSKLYFVFEILIKNPEFTALAKDEKLGLAEKAAELAEVLADDFPRLAAEHTQLFQTTLVEILSQPDELLEQIEKLHFVNDNAIFEKSQLSSGDILRAAGITKNYRVVDGILFEAYPVRADAFYGSSSPLIESGYVFSRNSDFLLTLPNGEKRRLNQMVLHLWSHGLDEMGGTDDQIYITAEEFDDLLKYAEENRDEDSERLAIEAVKKWLMDQIEN